MITARRFLVVQALLLWQGGFLFYAAVVVPTGSEVLGPFQQGRVTRHVTDTMNLIGIAALLVLAWDQIRSADFLRWRWTLWGILAVGLVCLFGLHPRIEQHVDFAADGKITDYPAFYRWHRVYLCVATAQWIAGLAYVAVTLRAWSIKRP